MAVSSDWTKPLSLLRQYNKDKKEITEQDGQIIFGEHAWPKNVKTNYLMFQKGTDQLEFYTLECLLYFLKNKHLIHPEYCKQAAAANIPAVRRPDRKNVLAYLNGETASSASIDESAPSEKPTQVKRTHDTDREDLTAKKPCVRENHVQEGRKQDAAHRKVPKESATVENKTII